jgi:pimeloyl-ACP methyl ester carboxylesterase
MTGFFEDLMEHERHGHLEKTLEGIPTLVLVGDRDLLTPPAHARALAASIPGARLITSPGAGHMLPLERDRHVSDMVESLIDPLLPAGAEEQEPRTGVPEAPRRDTAEPAPEEQ